MSNISAKRFLTAQEERLKTLRKQHKSLLRRIETERKKLASFKEETKRLFTSSAGVMQSKMQELQSLQKEFHATLEECAKSKLFTRQERKDFHWMKEDIGALIEETTPLGMSEEELEAFIRAQAEERGKAGFNFFEHFAPAIPEEEQKSIRELYKRLAARFHPDKAAGKPEIERRFHSIMQRINAAYRRGDIAELLAIEQEYADEAALEREDGAIVDIVEYEATRLAAELELCEAQLARLKTERKSLERTQEGKMVKEFRKAQKMGVNPIEEMTQEIDKAIEELKFNINLFRARLNGTITKKQMERQLDERHSKDLSFMGAEDEDFAQLLQQAAEQLFYEMEAEIRRGGRSSRAKAKR